jgi:ferredoxin
MTQPVRVGEVDERELDVDALWAQTARLAHERAHLMAGGEELRKERRPHDPRGAGEQDHAATLHEPGSRFAYNFRSASPGDPVPEPTEANPSETEPSLTYVIAEPCIGEKDNSCVEVCPVDCIHPTPDEPDYEAQQQLYIDPDECIDCDACVEACPVDACFAEDQLPEEWAKYTQINVEYYASK